MSKIIIADSSCLIALENINHLNILKELFQEIVITKAIASEFGNHLPDWITIQNPKSQIRVNELLLTLDLGESEAIVLASENKDSLLIIDEKKGRHLAKSLNITIIGTLKIIILAKQVGILNEIKPVLEKLKTVGFRISKNLELEILVITNEEE